jgi:cytochrome P450
MRSHREGITDDASLPILPVESPAFWADPEKFIAPARKAHPWLAKFSQGYLVHGYTANKDLLTDDDHLYMGLGNIVEFYDAEGTMWARFMKEMLNSQRGTEHTRIRNSAAAAFTPRRANQIRPLMRQVINELLDDWAPKGEFDFAEFASYFPIAVMCGLFGVSAEPIPRLRAALEAQTAGLAMNHDLKATFLAGFDTMWTFTDELLRAREASGTVDPEALVDAMIAAKNAGHLDETELRFFIMLLLFAGYDTSKNMLTMLMYLLLDRPAMYARCAEDRAYCTKVIAEGLRHSAVAGAFRMAATSFVYDGFRFPQGAMVFLAPNLASRDPLAFSDPMTFNPERKTETPHLAFGRGTHMCIGQFIARNQLEEGLHLIARRLANPRRAGEIAWRPFIPIGGLRTLPIRFDT